MHCLDRRSGATSTTYSNNGVTTLCCPVWAQKNYKLQKNQTTSTAYRRIVMIKNCIAIWRAIKSRYKHPKASRRKHTSDGWCHKSLLQACDGERGQLLLRRWRGDGLGFALMPALQPSPRPFTPAPRMNALVFAPLGRLSIRFARTTKGIFLNTLVGVYTATPVRCVWSLKYRIKLIGTQHKHLVVVWPHLWWHTSYRIRVTEIDSKLRLKIGQSACTFKNNDLYMMYKKLNNKLK